MIGPSCLPPFSNASAMSFGRSKDSRPTVLVPVGATDSDRSLAVGGTRGSTAVVARRFAASARDPTTSRPITLRLNALHLSDFGKQSVFLAGQSSDQLPIR